MAGLRDFDLPPLARTVKGIIFSLMFICVLREKGRDLTQTYGKSPYTYRKIQKATWQHKNATKNFYYTMIADRLTTVSWSLKSTRWSVLQLQVAQAFVYISWKKLSRLSDLDLEPLTCQAMGIIYSLVCISVPSLKRSRVTDCTSSRRPTYQLTNWLTCAKQYAPPSSIVSKAQ